jgi:hypothetical protein
VPSAIRWEYFASWKDGRVLEGNQHAEYARSRLKLLEDIADSIIEGVKHPWIIAVHLQSRTAVSELCRRI